MTDPKVRRLPVIDGHDPVGIVAQADVARALQEHPGLVEQLQPRAVRSGRSEPQAHSPAPSTVTEVMERRTSFSAIAVGRLP